MNLKTGRSWAVTSMVVLTAATLVACAGGPSAPVKSGSASSNPPSPDPATPAYARILDNAKVQVDTGKWKKDGPYHIAALTQGPINAWGSLYDAQLKASADANKAVASLEVFPSMGSSETQIQDIGIATNNKADILIVTPMNVAALNASLVRAQAAGIPTVLCQARSDGTGWVTEVSQPLYPNNFDAAVQLAERLHGKGNVVILNGTAGVDMADIALRAAKDAFAAYPGITVAHEGAANWSTADSKKLTSSWISSGTKIDGVLALGMEMGLGAAQAFLDAGKSIPILAGTGAMNGFNRLAIDNNVTFWSKAFAPGVASVCLDTAIKVLKGEKVTKFIDAEKRMDGVWVYDSGNARATFREDLDDQFPLGPVDMTDKQLIASGFGRR